MSKVIDLNTLSYFWGKIKTLFAGKQDTLVSGSNIKTVHGNTLLGSGDVTLNSDNIAYNGTGGGGIAPADSMTEAVDNLIGRIDNINPNEISSVTATESTASGGNNVVTITQTNGTTTSFNVKNGIDGVDGQDGADGVSLGEVALVQTTGDDEESVMSQKAVTEYGRKVTAEDLAGTSDWIKSILENEGWVFGQYLRSNGSGIANTEQPYAITHIISVDYIIRGHRLVFKYNNNKNTSSYVNWYNDGTRRGYLIGLNSDNEQATTIAPNIPDYNNMNGLRFTINYNDIPNCFIYDDTEKKYIWRGDEYLYNLIKMFDVNITYKALLDNVISQELGVFTQKTISQKVITEQFDTHDYIDKRYTYINGALCKIELSEHPNIDIREAEGISLVMDGENAAASYNAPLLVISNGESISSSNPMFMIQRYWSLPFVGFMAGWSSIVTGKGCSFPTNKKYNKWAHQVITFDFNTGESNIYINGVLWATATSANFDKESFRTLLREQSYMYINAPTSATQPTKITGVALFPRALEAEEVTTLFGAGGDETRGSLIPRLYDAYDTLAHTFTNWNIAQHTAQGDVTTNENGGKNITLKSGYDSVLLGFTGLSSATSFYHSIDFDFTITSGSCYFLNVQYNGNTFTTPCTITDSSGNIVDFSNTILTSNNTYHMRCVPTIPYNPSSYGALTVAFRFNNMVENTNIWVHENIVIRERGAALKLVHDNFRGAYWELYNGDKVTINEKAIYQSGNAFTKYYEPFKQNTIKYSSSVPPQFNGQMAVDSTNGKVYVGYLTSTGGTWKQINNS